MSSTQQQVDGTGISTVADKYFTAWEHRDPDEIIALHTPDTRFQIHVGSDEVKGAEAVREAFEAIFAQWTNFGFEATRVLLGKGHWVLDWTLTAELASENGPIPVRLDCLDVVEVSDDGLVASKDTYINGGDLTELAARSQA